MSEMTGQPTSERGVHDLSVKYEAWMDTSTILSLVLLQRSSESIGCGTCGNVASHLSSGVRSVGNSFHRVSSRDNKTNYSRPMALAPNRPIGSPLVVRDTVSQDFGHTESRSNAVYAAATYGLLLSWLAQFALLI